MIMLAIAIALLIYQSLRSAIGHAAQRELTNLVKSAVHASDAEQRASLDY